MTATNSEPLHKISCFFQQVISVMSFGGIVEMSSSTSRGLAGTVLVLTVFGICGCNLGKPTWTISTKSPDGKFIATANSYINSGWGTDSADTEVDLNYTTGSQKPTNVLVLPDVRYNSTDPALLRLTWHDSTHLQIDYYGHEEPTFQAIKFAGINISLRQD
jgi:hypothetical protein